MCQQIDTTNEEDTGNCQTFCLIISMIYYFNVFSYITSHNNFWYLHDLSIVFIRSLLFLDHLRNTVGCGMHEFPGVILNIWRRLVSLLEDFDKQLLHALGTSSLFQDEFILPSSDFIERSQDFMLELPIFFESIFKFGDQSSFPTLHPLSNLGYQLFAKLILLDNKVFE